VYGYVKIKSKNSLKPHKMKIELIKEKNGGEDLYCVYLNGEVVFASAYLSRATTYYEAIKSGGEKPHVHEVLASETI
jgi:hypothetical protein